MEVEPSWWAEHPWKGHENAASSLPLCPGRSSAKKESPHQSSNLSPLPPWTSQFQNCEK